MKYIVETISSFREIHVIEAENQEIAELIAQNSDYNLSKFLGQQTAAIYPYSEDHVERFKNEDKYFWSGVASIDSEGYLCYTRPGSDEAIRSADNERIVVK